MAMVKGKGVTTCLTQWKTSGFSRINKFATRRNLASKIIKKPWFILVFIVIVVAIVLIVRWVA